jgi:hypothetical protein
VEDRFPAFICPSATVTGIYQREVQLTDGQRRRLLMRIVGTWPAAVCVSCTRWLARCSGLEG